MCARVQRELGEIQRTRHRVRMEEGAIAGVPVRLFAPSVHSILPPGPVLLSLHGGGFIVDAGSVTENVPVAAYAKMPVVAPLYRLAPEYPFPGAVDDADAVYRALLADHAPEEIALYGTSAGACLCAQLLVRLRDTGGPLPRALGFRSEEHTSELSHLGISYAV